jgi:predicted  nucleic acid-binding Zn-ribbon protein
VINLRSPIDLFKNPTRQLPQSPQAHTRLISIEKPDLEKDSISILIISLKESLQDKLTKSSKLTQNIEQLEELILELNDNFEKQKFQSPATDEELNNHIIDLKKVISEVNTLQLLQTVNPEIPPVDNSKQIDVRQTQDMKFPKHLT